MIMGIDRVKERIGKRRKRRLVGREEDEQCTLNLVRERREQRGVQEHRKTLTLGKQIPEDLLE